MENPRETNQRLNCEPDPREQIDRPAAGDQRVRTLASRSAARRPVTRRAEGQEDGVESGGGGRTRLE
jgi:hypothetical protein